jgi:RNA polymerase sigma factor (sigma-70 family)
LPGGFKSGKYHRNPGDGDSLKISHLDDTFFRHEYGRLVALLARRFGVRHMEKIEDAVQSALMAAWTHWAGNGLPDIPGAWLYRVAYNHFIGELRQQNHHLQILENVSLQDASEDSQPLEPFFPEEVGDERLRMLFVCCDEAIPRESQLVLALKTLCGFSTQEIAARLFLSEANVHKRLARAREKWREGESGVGTPDLETLKLRIGRVHEVLYLLFNEGYLSLLEEEAIRRELCDEALRLAHELGNHPVGQMPETFALIALFHLHRARLPARLDPTGGLLLLEEQDRSLWNQDEIRLGMEWLQRSAHGAAFSRFHAEAGIAAEHGLAANFEQTRWKEIADLYLLLESIAPSSLHTLNRAIAISLCAGPQAGLAIVAAMEPPSWLIGSFLWDATLADLHRRAGHLDLAREHKEKALEAAPTEAMRMALLRRLKR